MSFSITKPHTESAADMKNDFRQPVESEEPSRASSFQSYAPDSGLQTPSPLLPDRDVLSRIPTASEDIVDQDLKVTTVRSTPSMGNALENLARSMSHKDQWIAEDTYELRPTMSRRNRIALDGRRSSLPPIKDVDGLAQEVGTPLKPLSQGVPPELRNFTSEIIFVVICSAGQLLFAWFIGDITVNQVQLKKTLGIANTQLPWLLGAFNIANGLSVILSGSLTDLLPPKSLMVGAFAWLMVWNVVGAFSLMPERAVLFFVVRAMQGLAVGVLASGSMGILGRVYKPGIRKTRVFASMAACAPFGFWLGAVQGGLLTHHLSWMFGTNAILCALCSAAAFFTIPTLKPAADFAGADAPSLRQFDYLGGLLASAGCVALLLGLLQGSSTSWAAYSYALIGVGLAFLIAFFFIERKMPRPLIPTRLWKTGGFTQLMLAYFFGFGAYMAWQFYAVQFWLRIVRVSPLTVAWYLLPNAVVGVLATWIVSRAMHLVPGHYLYITSMLAFALGPTFFLPQTKHTSYWALSMPGVALTTFGPDLSFAAASIFITSNVARSYQGSAGSLLMTVQNLAAAIVTSVADAVGAQVDEGVDGEVGLRGLRAIWWFGLACAVVGAGITILGVRIPKEEEKEHVT